MCKIILPLCGGLINFGLIPVSAFSALVGNVRLMFCAWVVGLQCGIHLLWSRLSLHSNGSSRHGHVGAEFFCDSCLVLFASQSTAFF